MSASRHVALQLQNYIARTDQCDGETANRKTVLPQNCTNTSFGEVYVAEFAFHCVVGQLFSDGSLGISVYLTTLL